MIRVLDTGSQRMSLSEASLKLSGHFSLQETLYISLIITVT